VVVYAQSEAVNLFLNGQPISATPVPVSYSTQFKATFKVPYQPGQLTAVLYRGGQAVANRTLVTAGAPAKLRLTAEAPQITASRRDLAYIWVEVVDANDVVVPVADNVVQVSVTGVGELAAFGSSNPVDTSSFTSGSHAVFRGRAVAILRPGSATTAPSAGSITLHASAPGLADADITVQVV
jgi:beta-galactosidase